MFRFPFTDFHELNLDWIISKIKHIDKRTERIVNSVNGSSGDVEIPILSPATTNPKPLGEYPAIGIDDNYARADHVHPLPNAADIGAAPEVVEISVNDNGDVTQTLAPGTIYHFTGALSSLTINLMAPGAGIIPQYHFDFNSGSTAPTVALPASVTMPGGTFTPEASKRYEIDILNNYGTVMSW